MVLNRIEISFFLIDMTIASETYMKKKKISDKDYHVKKMGYLMNDGRNLMKIPNFPIKGFYQRKDDTGWWMPIKQFAIKSYTNLYLEILQRKEYIDTCFIDPLSSYGMIKLTKNQGKDILLIPGTSFNAALISIKKNKGFSEYYINDMNPDIRGVINSRFEAFNHIHKNTLKINIEAKESGKVDSNKWIIDILNIIKNTYKYPNYLMVIDNQGMDIGYETLEKIRNFHEFGDIIITFHDSAFSRAIHNEKKIKFFYGCKVKKDTTIEERRNIYINQLQSIGFGRIEQLFVRSKGNFFYTLLFCCRENVSADWLDMIEDFRKKRFKYCTDQFMKQIYDITKKRTTTLDEFY